MPRLLTVAVVAALAGGVVGQEPEHRPVRPKGRYFTQDQLQRALEEAKADPGKASDQPPPQLSETTKSLLDFAKQNPELAKSLLEAAKNLARDNPDLLRGGNDEAAKRLAEQMARKSNLGELLKNLDQKPPPSNMKRRPSDKHGEKGRSSREKKDANEGDGNPQEQPQPEPTGEGRPQPLPMPDANSGSPKNFRSPLADLAGQSPDYVKSLFEELKKKVQNGKPPTREQVDEAVDKVTEQMKNDPTFAPMLNDPQTQEKIHSPKLRDEVMKQLAPRAPPSNGRRTRPRDDTASPEQPPANESPEKSSTPDRAQDRPDAPRTQPGDQRTNEAKTKRPNERNDQSLKDVIESFEKERTKKADSARKAVAEQMKDQGRTPGDREPTKEPSSKEAPSPNVEQLADLLKQNPGLMESLAKTAGAGGDGAGGRQALKDMLDAFKGTGLENDLRDIARELNKDGSLNDFLKGRDDSKQPGESAPRNRPSDQSSAPKRSAVEEASKAFKSLAGEEFNAGKLGDTMKSLGAALKNQTARDEESPWSKARPPATKSAGDGLGDGLLGMLGRGASKVGEWSAKASQKISENVAPGFETPKINPPAFGEMRSLSLPSAETGGKAVLILGIIAALVFGGWMLLRRSEIVLAGGPIFGRLPKLSLAGLPPREQAALLFERAALERLGEPARPKNHVTLAEKLCSGTTPDSQALAEVYEAARYTPPTDPFQSDNVNVVREIIARNRPLPKAKEKPIDDGA